MRKSIKFMCLALLCGLWILPTMNVSAGNINSEEQRLIDAAKHTYYYDGKKYEYTEEGLERAKNYLKQDDVDLTKEQVNKAIAKLDDSVEDGIAQGFLKEVKSGSSGSEGGNGGGSESSVAESSTVVESTPVASTVESSVAQSTVAQSIQVSTVESSSVAESSTESAVESSVVESSAVESTESVVESATVESSVVESSVEAPRPKEFNKGLNLPLIAGIIVILVVIIGGVIVLRHKLANRK